MKKLIVAGTGVKFLSHLTLEVKSLIATSSCILYLLNEPALKNWVARNSKNAISLDSLYFSNSVRSESYHEISKEIFKYLERYEDVCFLTYGHPVFFCSILTELKKQAEREPIEMQILPGISALDCLFADLGVDPSERGMQSYEATEFLVYDRVYSPTTHLVLWQIAVIGATHVIHNEPNFNFQKKGLSLLVTKLLDQYPETHQVCLYVASQYPHIPFELTKLKLIDIIEVQIPRLATLYIPPAKKKTINQAILRELNCL